MRLPSLFMAGGEFNKPTSLLAGCSMWIQQLAWHCCK
jgi:hypothetical protein